MEEFGSANINGQLKRARAVKWLLVIGLMAFLPWIFEMSNFANYLTYITVRILILGIFAMSYDLLFGYTGMLSLGHALFQGASAYTIAILTVQLGLNIQDAFLPIMVALVVGVILGFVQGFLACRLGHTGVFLITFATAETLFLLILADPFGITNSENGISDIPRETVLGLLNIKPELNFYYFVLGLLILSYLALRAITRLPFGDTLKAICENPQRSKYLGYNIRQYRIAAFMVSGFFASLAARFSSSFGASCPRSRNSLSSAWSVFKVASDCANAAPVSVPTLPKYASYIALRLPSFMTYFRLRRYWLPPTFGL